MTSITSSQTTPEPTNNQIRNTIIEEGIIKSLHGIDERYVKRVENCCHSWAPHIEGKRLIICETFICRFCRRKRLDDIRIKQYHKNKIHTENGGKILLITLTIPHRNTDELSYLYPRFRTALSQMKQHYGWKTNLQKYTNYSYHYDNFEITHSVENGFHPHNHITFCCNPFEKLDLQKIKDELTKLWSYYIKKNKFPYISKKIGVDVKETTMGMHSSSYATKTLDDLDVKKGTLEYYERKLHQHIQHHHPPPDNMNKLQIKNTIKQLLETFNRIRKGKRHSTK